MFLEPLFLKDNGKALDLYMNNYLADKFMYLCSINLNF